MIVFKKLIVLCITCLIPGLTLNCMAQETVFKNYLGQTLKTVMTAEGAPDEMTREAGLVDYKPWPTIEDMLADDYVEEAAEDYLLIYKHKMLAGREFTVRYETGGEIIYSALYVDNNRETAPIHQVPPGWTWLDDMGKSQAEIMERWGLPQNYINNVNWQNGYNFGITTGMLYDKVDINGQVYSLTYHFYHNAVTGVSGILSMDVSDVEYINYFNEAMTAMIDLLDEPAWVCMPSRFSKIPVCSLATDKFIVTIDDILSSSAAPQITTAVWAVDNADNVRNALWAPTDISRMISYWERDNAIRGGNYNKLITLKKKISTKMEEIEKQLDAQKPYGDNR